MSSASAHILVLPCPAQGHMIPILDLTHQLALRGLTITIVVTPRNLSFLNPLLATHPTSIETLVLPFPSHPSVPPGCENGKDLPVMDFPFLLSALRELSNPIVEWFNSHPSPPTAILSDLFFSWSAQLATQLGIKRLVFSSFGAFAVSILYCVWRDLAQNDENTLVPLPNVPNCPLYPFYQLPLVFRQFAKQDSDLKSVRHDVLENIGSWGIVLNSYSELESVELNRLKTDLGHERVFAVGPLLPPSDTRGERGGSSSVEVNDVISWLDACSDRSVVYVCFGSLAVLSNQQMEELARGLEKSGTKFLWGVREATIGHVAGEFGAVPIGFEDRVAGRGFVIRGWTPQVVILNHRAIGSFLTHGGWNSVLEGLVAGVPLMTWPMGADQYLNSNLLVDHMGIAVRVCENASTIPNADELAQKIRDSINGNRLLSARAMKMTRAALNAVKEDGSSFKDLKGLVRELHVLSVKSNK